MNASVKSRAVSAIDRLLGGVFDVPGAHIEGIVDRIKARNSVKEALIRAEGEAALEKLGEDPSFGNRVINRFVQEEARKQQNRDAVAQEAIAALEDQSRDDRDNSSSAEKPELDEDWMNVFSVHAENASSDRLRQLWGRILAGEVRKPGSFSLTTLRVISELDQRIASLFQDVIRERDHESQFIPKPESLEGEVLLNLTFLEEVGLLQDVLGNLNTKLKAQDDGKFYYLDGGRVLILNPKTERNMLIHVIKISRVGMELASILPPPEGDAFLRRVAEHTRKHCKEQHLAWITQRRTNGFSFNAYESLM